MNDIYLDSRRIKKNDLFISLKGTKDDGIYHIKEVIKNGGKLMYSDNFSYNFYPNLKENLNRILLNYYKVKFNFKIIGITGTNRKTSTAYLLTKALNYYGYKAKCISTINDEDCYYSKLTTPRNDDLVRILKKAETDNIDYLIMEVSSIGFKECRVNDIPFSYGILTSLESDHLDYHKTILNYHLSKIEFIEKCDNKIIGINIDAKNLLKKILSNFLKNDEINTFLLNLPQVPGREEVICKNPLVIVDYAHTSSALEYILNKYKNMIKGKLISIIGAGGNRDKSKRSIYGELVNNYSDIFIITTDNPRNENPIDIINDISQKTSKELIIVNREEAIKKGIELLDKNDVLLVLGKGDEEYMEINGTMYKFKDKEIIKKYLNKN